MSERLLAACVEFVRKCENGEARSVRSYKQMKEAIAEYEEKGTPQVCLMCCKQVAESELRMANGEYYTMDELKAELLGEQSTLPKQVLRLDKYNRWFVIPTENPDGWIKSYRGDAIRIYVPKEEE